MPFWWSLTVIAPVLATQWSLELERSSRLFRRCKNMPGRGIPDLASLMPAEKCRARAMSAQIVAPVGVLGHLIAIFAARN